MAKQVVGISKNSIGTIQVTGWRTPEGRLIIGRPGRHDTFIVDADCDDWPERLHLGLTYLQLKYVNNEFNEVDKDGNIYELADYVVVNSTPE